MHLPFAACKPPPALSTRDEQMKDLTPKLTWIELHKEELMANWHAGRLSGEFFKLDPLR